MGRNERRQPHPTQHRHNVQAQRLPITRHRRRTQPRRHDMVDPVLCVPLDRPTGRRKRYAGAGLRDQLSELVADLLARPAENRPTHPATVRTQDVMRCRPPAVATPIDRPLAVRPPSHVNHASSINCSTNRCTATTGIRRHRPIRTLTSSRLRIRSCTRDRLTPRSSATSSGLNNNRSKPRPAGAGRVRPASPAAAIV